METNAFPLDPAIAALCDAASVLNWMFAVQFPGWSPAVYMHGLADVSPATQTAAQARGVRHLAYSSGRVSAPVRASKVDADHQRSLIAWGRNLAVSRSVGVHA
jgi:hypothetical protein